MNQTVRALVVLPSGDLVAGGDFTVAGGVTAVRLARWDGAAWQPFTTGPNGRVRALGVHRATGSLIPGGEFSSVAGTPTAGSALLSTTCPATVTSYGAAFSCPGTALQLTATSLPWLGAKFESRCSGFGTGTLAIAVFGAQQQFVALNSIYPAALPGCVALTTMDTTALLTTGANSASASYRVPSSVALIGSHLFHQMFEARLDPQQVPYGARSSNGLDLMFGFF